MYRRFLKRIIDFTGALLLVAVFFPIFILVTMLLFWVNGGKPFFFQKRPGKKEKVFTIIKFKTMTDQLDGEGNLLPDEDRLTTIGKIVRKTSIDELPQIINVLKGDMSFIGPRPLLIRYLPFYTEKEKLRHSVRPGITGLAQVSGRNLLHWDERLAKDIEYVENISFVNDVKVIISTIKNVLTAKDVAVNAESVMIDLDADRQS